MNKTKNLADEIAEFHAYVKDIKPLSQSSHPPSPRKKLLVKKQLKKNSALTLLTSAPPLAVTHEEILNFSRAGLQHKIIRQLKQRQLVIAAELDLHGLTSTQAAATLIKFIAYCQQQNFRCVKIIHGKGQRKSSLPILKNHINHWLRQIPAVLAFHSAKPADGGAGAIYVLLTLI